MPRVCVNLNLEEQTVMYLIVNTNLSDDTSVLLGADSGDGCQTHGDGARLSTFDGPKVKAGEVKSDVPVLWVRILTGVFLALAKYENLFLY